MTKPQHPTGASATNVSDVSSRGELSPEDAKHFEETLSRVEARLDRLERYLGFPPLTAGEPTATGTAVPPAAGADVEKHETALEMRIGEFWLARVGIVALLVGLAFLITYPFATLPALVPCLFGYAAVGGLFALDRYWRQSFPYLSRIAFRGGLFLLYFATLRLHFFSACPVVTNKPVALALLVVVLVVEFILVARRQSQFGAGIVVMLCLATSVVSDTLHFALALPAVAGAVILYLHRRHNWQALFNVTIALVYGTHLLWLFGNPVMGHPLQAVTQSHGSLVYLFVYAGLFAAGNCFHYESSATMVARIIRTIFNGTGLFVLGNLAGLTFYREHMAGLDLLLHVFYMSTATLYWLYRRSRFSTSIYACFGYLALSAAIFAHFPAPDYFVWLGWQSLLVAATAIWFCSKIIIVTNVFIYAGIYVAYLIAAPATGIVDFSFAAVALLTVRTLKWQKDRLELRTELLRNIYLAATCAIVPFGLSHTVPKAWVSLSWMGAALVYFLLSLVLKNKKYRWMAIVTIFAAVVYAFVVDLARLEAAYRIISFSVLGIVLLVVSLFYARHRKKTRPSSTEPTS